MDSVWNHHGDKGECLMISLKFKSLLPVVSSFRKFGILWRKVGYCCGMVHDEAQIWLMIKFTFKRTVYWRCPQCGRLHAMRFYYHAVLVHDDKTRRNNKGLE